MKLPENRTGRADLRERYPKPGCSDRAMGSPKPYTLNPKP